MLIKKTFSYASITALFFSIIVYFLGLGHESGVLGFFITILHMPTMQLMFSLLKVPTDSYSWIVVEFALCAFVQWFVLWGLFFWLRSKFKKC